MNRTNRLFLSAILLCSHHAVGDAFVAGELAPVAVRDDGSQVAGNSPATDPSGRFIVFATVDPLAPQHRRPGDRPYIQVYLYDHFDEAYELISIGMDGFAPEDGDCSSPAVSDDGRYVTFLSSSAQLVEDDTTSQRYIGHGLYVSVDDCFVRDRLLQKTVRVSLSSRGEEANETCFHPDISGDGRFVTFHSWATNLVEDDPDQSSDVFVHDLETGTTRLASLWSDGSHMLFDCLNPSISSDGRYVAFENHYGAYVCVRDMKTSTTDVILRDCKGEIGDCGRFFWFPAIQISDNGRFVVFTSLSNKPMVNVPPAWGYIYLFDRETREMTMVAALDQPPDLVDAWGINLQSTGGYLVTMSGDGRYVLFSQWEGNHKELHLYRYDRLGRSTDEVVRASLVTRPYLIPWGGSCSVGPAVNRDGSVVTFATASEDFYGSFTSVGEARNIQRFRLFRVELWEYFSVATGWGLYR